MHVCDPSMPRQTQWTKLAKIVKERSEYVFPNSYLVLDIETDSVRPASGNILQIGHLLCINGEIKSNHAAFVQTDDATLLAYDNNAYVARQKAEGNDGYVKSADVRKHGVDRKIICETLGKLYDASMGLPNAVVIGHNLSGFDVPFIENFSTRVGAPIKFDRKRIIDTGSLFKANKLGALPADEEPSWNFFARVRGYRAKGVFWRLSLAARDLDITGQLPFSLDSAHDAGADCLITHYVYQAMRDKVMK